MSDKATISAQPKMVNPFALKPGVFVDANEVQKPKGHEDSDGFEHGRNFCGTMGASQIQHAAEPAASAVGSVRQQVAELQDRFEIQSRVQALLLDYVAYRDGRHGVTEDDIIVACLGILITINNFDPKALVNTDGRMLKDVELDYEDAHTPVSDVAWVMAKMAQKDGVLEKDAGTQALGLSGFPGGAEWHQLASEMLNAVRSTVSTKMPPFEESYMYTANMRSLVLEKRELDAQAVTTDSAKRYAQKIAEFHLGFLQDTTNPEGHEANAARYNIVCCYVKLAEVTGLGRYIEKAEPYLNELFENDFSLTKRLVTEDNDIVGSDYHTMLKAKFEDLKLGVTKRTELFNAPKAFAHTIPAGMETRTAQVATNMKRVEDLISDLRLEYRSY